MAVALAYRRGVRMPPAMAFFLVAAAIAEFAWYTSAPSTEIPRWIGYGGPAVQTVAAFALIDRTFSFRVVEKLGDASYALYLIHPVIISAARTLAKKGYVNPADAAWPYLIGITTIGVCASLIVYRFIEKPATERCWRTLLNITSYPPRRFVRLDPS